MADAISPLPAMFCPSIVENKLCSPKTYVIIIDCAVLVYSMFPVSVVINHIFRVYQSSSKQKERRGGGGEVGERRRKGVERS